MELRVLRYFLAAARESNITRAARSLHVSQPTLSPAIKRSGGRAWQETFLSGVITV